MEKLEYYLQAKKDFIHKNDYELIPFVLNDGKKHPVAILCPGGGYKMVCTFTEGIPFARYLNSKGINAFVLYYHVKKKAFFPAPQEDLCRAIKEVFDNQEKYNLDLSNYSLWGASAGGHLVASFGTELLGYKKYGVAKPNTLVLTYPVITFKQDTHKSTKKYHLGANPTSKMIEMCSLENIIDDNYPRTFVWCSKDDKSVSPNNSLLLVDSLKRHHIEYQFELYPSCKHGSGLAIKTSAEGWIDKAIDFWLNKSGNK